MKKVLISQFVTVVAVFCLLNPKTLSAQCILKVRVTDINGSPIGGVLVTVYNDPPCKCDTKACVNNSVATGSTKEKKDKGPTGQVELSVPCDKTYIVALNGICLNSADECVNETTDCYISDRSNPMHHAVQQKVTIDKKHKTIEFKGYEKPLSQRKTAYSSLFSIRRVIFSPNPAQQFVSFETGRYEGNVRLIVINSLGQVLASYDINLKGEEHFFFDIGRLTNGIYSVNVIGNGGQIARGHFIKAAE